MEWPALLTLQSGEQSYNSELVFYFGIILNNRKLQGQYNKVFFLNILRISCEHHHLCHPEYFSVCFV